MIDETKETERSCTVMREGGEAPLSLGPGELRTLRRLVTVLEGREREIARCWGELYERAFGERAFYETGEFESEALLEVETVFSHVKAGDRDGLGAWYARRGRALFRAGVPFSEVCRSLHLFETSVIAELRTAGLPDDEVLTLCQGLDHLSHERLILLVESYHLGCKWRWMEREEGLIASAARREREEGRRERLCGLLGRSEPMQRVYERLSLASRSREAVLLVGETGTGKEIAARTIHALSGDPPERYVAVNCAAISRDLVESELFGHVKGAFSGARADHPGLFRAAHGGTLFLDEVTELPTSAQAKLLRALQEKAVRPVGALEEVPFSVRIVASTNRAVRPAIDDGLLRRDLFYRLRQLVISLPPLREKAEDLPLLVDHFRRQAVSDGLCRRAATFSEGALARLCAHSWPGNVRELENVVRLACRMALGGEVGAEHLSFDIPGGPGGLDSALSSPEETPISLQEAERDAIERALRSTEGNKTHAARLLGISRKQLYVKIGKYGLG